MTLDSHLPDTVRPHRKPSLPHKRPYSTPKLTILGSADGLSREVAGAFLADVGPAAEPDALRAYRAAVEQETIAWRAVAMRLPGSVGFDANAWRAWKQASSAAQQARAEWEPTVFHRSSFGQLTWKYNP